MSVVSMSVPAELPRQDQRDLGVRDCRVTVDGMRTQYLEAGVGPPLLLLHGYEQSATSWRWVIPALARTHRVLALSLPGHGDTDPAVGGYAPGRDLAPFVAGFLEALAVGSFDVVGNSVGGAVALRLALAEPRRVRTLTLVSSAGLGRDVNPLLVLAGLPVMGELAILISRVPGGDLLRTTMSAAMLFAQPWRVPGEFVAEQHALGRRAGQLEAATATARALFDVSGQREVLLDHLHTLTMPTLVVWGGCDYVLPAYQAQAAVDRLPRGRLSLFPGCGHLPHVERPERFAAVLGEFLTAHQHTPATSRTAHRHVPTSIAERPTMAPPTRLVASTAPDRQLPRRRPARHLVAEHTAASGGAEQVADAYGSQAGRYEQRTGAFCPWRELLVDELPARSGDTVLDVGCGTGLCLPLLRRKVGLSGTIVGIDESEQMLRVAADRVAEHGWDNVRLIAAPVARAPIDGTADAALFCAVHDVLQSPAALAHIFDHLRPGAPVAAAGGKWPAPWLWPLGAWVAALHAPFVNDSTGFDRPWQLLAEFVPDLRVHELAFGAGYLTLGHAGGR